MSPTDLTEALAGLGITWPTAAALGVGAGFLLALPLLARLARARLRRAVASGRMPPPPAPDAAEAGQGPATAEAAERERRRERARFVLDTIAPAVLGAVILTLAFPGLVDMAEDNADYMAPLSWIVIVSLEGTAVWFAVQRFMRAQDGYSDSALLAVLTWGVIAVSAALQYHHARTAELDAGGTAFRTLLPLLLAVVVELALHMRRTTVVQRKRARNDQLLDSALKAHPVEYFAVRRMLAANAGAGWTAQQAIDRVRTRAAGRALHTFRAIKESKPEFRPPDNPKKTGKAQRRHDRAIRWWNLRAERARTRTIRTIERMNFNGPPSHDRAADLLRDMQVRVMVDRLALLDYTSEGEALALLTSLITPEMTRDAVRSEQGVSRGGPEGEQSPGVSTGGEPTEGESALPPAGGGESPEGAAEDAHTGGEGAEESGPALTGAHSDAHAERAQDAHTPDATSLLPRSDGHTDPGDDAAFAQLMNGVSFDGGPSEGDGAHRGALVSITGQGPAEAPAPRRAHTGPDPAHPAALGRAAGAGTGEAESGGEDVSPGEPGVPAPRGEGVSITDGDRRAGESDSESEGPEDPDDDPDGPRGGGGGGGFTPPEELKTRGWKKSAIMRALDYFKGDVTAVKAAFQQEGEPVGGEAYKYRNNDWLEKVFGEILTETGDPARVQQEMDRRGYHYETEWLSPLVERHQNVRAITRAGN